MSKPAEQLPELDSSTLDTVHGGFDGSIDWVNLGGGVATGFCALGPLLKHSVSALKELAARRMAAKPPMMKRRPPL